MKLLVFHIGADRYGLRLRDVVRVLPLLELKQLPLAPDSVAGLTRRRLEEVEWLLRLQQQLRGPH